MKRALIVCLFWAISLNAGINEGLCSTPMFPPLQPLQPVGASNSSTTSLAEPFTKNSEQDSYEDQYIASASANYPRISEIERSLYGQNFTKQDILLRLARIEKSIFSTSYPKMTLAQRVDNIVANFNQINDFPNISKNTLSGIETKILKRNYNQNNVEERIERLEQQIFGATQSGELASRFETLKTAARDYNPNPYMTDYNQTPFANTQKRGGWKNIVGTLGSIFMGGGTMTGFTPAVIDPFNNYNNGYSNNNATSYNNSGLYSNGYNSNFNNNGLNNFASMGNPNGYGQYNGYRSNRGYSDSFKNYGSGSRVTILD